MDSWIIWCVAGIVILMLEVFKPGYLFLGLGSGLIAAGMFSLLTQHLLTQLIVFAVVFLAVYLWMKKNGAKFIRISASESKILRLQNKKGTITQKIDKDNSGYVRIGGEEWPAVGHDKVEISEGKTVKVVSFAGNKLVVRLFSPDNE